MFNVEPGSKILCLVVHKIRSHVPWGNFVIPHLPYVCEPDFCKIVFIFDITFYIFRNPVSYIYNVCSPNKSIWFCLDYKLNNKWRSIYICKGQNIIIYPNKDIQRLVLIAEEANKIGIFHCHISIISQDICNKISDFALSWQLVVRRYICIVPRQP